MKKLTVSIAVLLTAVVSFGALDTSIQNFDEVLPSIQTTNEIDDVLILAPIAKTNGQSAVGSTITLTDYAKIGTLIVGFNTGPDAAHTSTVSFVYGTTTNCIDGTNLFYNTGTTAGAFQSAEVNFDTLQGTNAALYGRATFSVVTADGESIASVVLARKKARAALQTINSSALDVSAYKGVGTVLIDLGTCELGATNYIGSIVLQDAAASTGTWAAISGTATTTLSGTTSGSLTEIAVDFSSLNKYLRAVFTTTNDYGNAAVILSAP